MHWQLQVAGRPRSRRHPIGTHLRALKRRSLKGCNQHRLDTALRELQTNYTPIDLWVVGWPGQSDHDVGLSDQS